MLDPRNRRQHPRYAFRVEAKVCQAGETPDRPAGCGVHWRKLDGDNLAAVTRFAEAREPFVHEDLEAGPLPVESTLPVARMQLAATLSRTSANTLYTGLTDDLKEGGVFVAMIVPPPVGTVVDVALTLDDARVDFKGVVAWRRESVRHGHIVDISLGGVRLDFGKSSPPREGTPLDLAMVLGGVPEQLKAVVCWSFYGAGTAGVRFVELTPTARTAIEGIAATTPEVPTVGWK